MLSAFVLVGALSALAPATSAADEVDWMYQPAALVEINLGGLSEAELDELEAEPSEEVHGTFELKVDGVAKASFEDVGIRLKGGTGSFKPIKTGKAGFKIRFDKFVDDQLFFGLQRLTLNNMVQDPSMVHETLTYEIFRALGLPASRTGYALVRVNGEFFGVYLNIETLDKIFLAAHFASTQHLYEADAPGVDVRTGEAGTFEVDRGDEGDLTDLDALITAANDVEGDWSDGMAPSADLTEMTRVWAVERYVSHWDGYAGVQAPFRPNNYYLHSLASGIFEMLPWGADQTWETKVEFDEPAGGLLFNNCLADESCEALYEQGLEEVQAAVPALELGRQVSCLTEMLAPWQQVEPESRRRYDAEEIAEGVDETRELVSDRPGELADFLGVAAPDVPPSNAPCSVPPAGPATVTFTLPPQVSVSGGLRLERVSVKRGALVAHLAVALPGRLALWGTVGPRRARTRICTEDASVAAGSLKLRCKLSAEALHLRSLRKLHVRFNASFEPAGGAPEAVVRSVGVPKAASSDRSR
ncbi:MAG TPA: CotH kinase family protein [Solirubrobacterales bacterium]|nr:CotH kinase family protein [Solirubrobacterales bacterium]